MLKFHTNKRKNRIVSWHDTSIGTIEPMLGYFKWAYLPDRFADMPTNIPAEFNQQISGHTQHEIKSRMRRLAYLHKQGVADPHDECVADKFATAGIDYEPDAGK